MPDVAAWLAARLAEVEATARAAIPEGGTGKWPFRCQHKNTIGPIPYSHDLCARLDCDEITIYDEGGHSVEQAEHIAAWDPATVLRHVAAERELLEMHSREIEPEWDGKPYCGGCGDGERYHRMPWPCETLLNRARAWGYEEKP
jgi:hypothetical protein